MTVPLRFPDGYVTTARVHTFHGLVDGREHLAFGLGEHADADPPLVRPHSGVPHRGRVRQPAAATAARSCAAVERIAQAGGYLLYLRQEGAASACTPSSTRTPSRTAASTRTRRTWRSGAARTARLHGGRADAHRAGRGPVSLLSNNPDKAAQLERLGVTVADRVSTGVHLSPANAGYLAAKVTRADHALDLPFVP
ncbi:GTP cyclohydrolase [Micromonospora sp. BRA006-A]|nr:GTP cyclohydrolase [Micromonospora sp. BRA006-A]